MTLWILGRIVVWVLAVIGLLFVAAWTLFMRNQ